MHDGLANPPNGIGNKTGTAIGVKFPRGLDQPKIAFVNEICHRDAGALVFACDLHHKAQISFNQFLHSLGIALPDATPKIDLFLGGRHRPAADFR
jgi:hypothetical protein